jgi:membrane dipeptidase
MNRRAFLHRSLQLSAALALPPLRLLAQSGAAPALADAYRNWIVIDALCSLNFEDLPLKADAVQQAMQSGVTAVNWTVSDTDFEKTVEYVAFIQAVADADPGHWLIVRHHADLDRAKHEQKIGIMMGFQHPQPIGDNLDRLETFRRLDVRIMQLSYNNRSLFGDGCLEPENSGLSRLGRAAVARMNELGIAVDLAHAGQRTTAQAIEASGKPVIISHTGCNAIHQHPRNRDDGELKALADRGGVAGIYFMPYLVASPTVPTHEHAIAHLDHALRVCGEDHVGIGSDGTLDTWPDTPEQKKLWQENIDARKKAGIAAPEEDRPPVMPDLNNTRRLLIIAEGLIKKGYSIGIIEKVLGNNFYRVLGEIWG